MIIPIPTASKLEFDMNVAVKRTLQESKSERKCGSEKCLSKFGYGRQEITDKKQFLMLELVLFDSYRKTLTGTCIPLQNLEITVGGVHKKYELTVHH